MNNTYELLLESSNEASFIEYENNGKLLNSVPDTVLNNACEASLAHALFFSHRSEELSKYMSAFEADGAKDGKKSVWRRMWESIKAFFRKMWDWIAGLFTKTKKDQPIVKSRILQMQSQRDKIRTAGIVFTDEEGENDSKAKVSKEKVNSAHAKYAHAKKMATTIENGKVISNTRKAGTDTVALLNQLGAIAKKPENAGDDKKMANTKLLGMSEKVNSTNEEWKNIKDTLEKAVKNEDDGKEKLEGRQALDDLMAAPEFFENLFTSTIMEIIDTCKEYSGRLNKQIQSLDSSIKSNIENTDSEDNKPMDKFLSNLSKIGQNSISASAAIGKISNAFSNALNGVTAFYGSVKMPS